MILFSMSYVKNPILFKLTYLVVTEIILVVILVIGLLDVGILVKYPNKLFFLRCSHLIYVKVPSFSGGKRLRIPF